MKFMLEKVARTDRHVYVSVQMYVLYYIAYAITEYPCSADSTSSTSTYVGSAAHTKLVQQCGQLVLYLPQPTRLAELLAKHSASSSKLPASPTPSTSVPRGKFDNSKGQMLSHFLSSIATTRSNYISTSLHPLSPQGNTSRNDVRASSDDRRKEMR